MRKPAPPRDVPPPLELLCLRTLWDLGEGNVHDVRKALQGSKPLAYTTVMTLLDRLARKGAVSRRKTGRAFVYAPAVSREKMRRLALKEFVEAFFDGSEDALTNFLGRAEAAMAAPDRAAPSLDTALL